LLALKTKCIYLRKMKKLVFIANIRLPTEKAHGLAVMKMCEAFANQGIETTLVVPRRLNRVKVDPFEYYEIERVFKLKRLPSLDLVWFGKLGFLIQWFSFAKMVALYSIIHKDDIYYGRDELSLLFVNFLGRKIFWEAHNMKDNWIVRNLIKNAQGVVSINKELENHYVGLGAARDKSLVVPSGVDLGMFESVTARKVDLRKKLNLPTDKKIVAYVGRLNAMGHSKGLEGIDSAFGFLNTKRKDIFTMMVSNVHPKEVPSYMKASDVLIMNYPSDEYHHFMSPLKMFEYMASVVPITTSDVTSIREILDDDTAFFCKPNDYKDLAKSILYALDNPQEAISKAKKAFEKVKMFSWSNRAKIVTNFIND